MVDMQLTHRQPYTYEYPLINRTLDLIRLALPPTTLQIERKEGGGGDTVVKTKNKALRLALKCSSATTSFVSLLKKEGFLGCHTDLAFDTLGHHRANTQQWN